MLHKLLSPFDLSGISLSNRIIMAPMTRCRVNPDGTPSEITTTYYVQRASAGLIISEAINISADAIGSLFTPSIFSDAQVTGWRRITDAVHAAGGRMFAQLWHSGRVAHSAVRGGILPVAPSAIAITGQQHFTGTGMADYEVPRALTTTEVRATIADFGRAAARAKEAGFDGIELHGAFGYLPNQFLVDSANQRVDEYGGPIANRCRFMLETVKELVSIWGNKRVGIRLSPVNQYNSMIDSNPKALFSHLLTELDEMDLAYVHLMNPLFPLDAFPDWPKDVLGTFRALVRCPVIANGGYDAATADAELVAGRADLVSFGSLFISNPDLPARFAAGAALVQPDTNTFYAGGGKGYTDYLAMRVQ